MAQLEQAYTNLDTVEHLSVQEMSNDVMLLLIKQIGFDELVIMDYLVKPVDDYCVVSECVNLVLSLI